MPCLCVNRHKMTTVMHADTWHFSTSECFYPPWNSSIWYSTIIHTPWSSAWHSPPFVMKNYYFRVPTTSHFTDFHFQTRLPTQDVCIWNACTLLYIHTIRQNIYKYIQHFPKRTYSTFCVAKLLYTPPYPKKMGWGKKKIKQKREKKERCFHHFWRDAHMYGSNTC